MSTSAHYANLNDLDLSTPEFKDERSQTLESDREIHPDHLSDDHGEGHAHKEGAPKSSMLGSALNIANTVMGSGVIALPNVISQFGILLGSLIIGFSCCLTIISCHLLLKAKNLSRHSKFITIGKHCFGVRGLWAVKAIIIVNNFGLCIIYLIVFSTTALNLIKGFSSEDCDTAGKIYCQHWLLVLIGTTIVLPFIFANSMAKLQKASVISVIAAITFSIATIEYSISTAATGENKLLDQVHVLPNIGDIVSALSSITSVFIAFTFQFNFFPVYKSLKNPTDKRMKITATSGLLIALTIYLTAANAGYIAFPTTTQNFLLNFSRSVGLPTFIIVNCAFLFSSTLAQPLMFFGCKNEIYGVIKIVRRKFDKRRLMRQISAPSQEQLVREEQAFDLEDEHDEKALEAKYGFKGIYYKLYVAVLFGFIVLMAIIVPKINIVFSFVGSTAANGLNFLLPALFYLHLCSKYGKLKKISIFIFIFGIISGVVGIVTTAITL